MEKTVGCFLLRNLWKYKVGGGIFVTPIKSPLVTRELKVLTLKCNFDYKDYRMQVQKRR
jgi:hypothetical protein